MEALVFPVAKKLHNFGQRSFNFKGKEYEDMMAQLPAYDGKIMQAQTELNSVISQDKAQALAQYLEFKRLLFERDKLENFDQSLDDKFQDKMKLLAFYNILGNKVLDAYGFLQVEAPYGWLNENYLLYLNYVGLSMTNNYVQANRVRIPKLISQDDFCQRLGKSLKNDNGWATGKAKDAQKLVFGCYDIFPYEEAMANEAIDVALLMSDFYVFTNFTSNGLGLSSIFQIIKEQQFPFDSNYRFHNYMATTLNNLNDAHISYKAECYEQFTFIQPLFFQELVIEDVDNGISLTRTNIPELENWLDHKIVHIDGMNVKKFLHLEAGKWGKCHGVMNRFSLGFSRKYFDSAARDFKLDRGLFLKRTVPPNRPYVVYSLQNWGSDYIYEVKVDWLVFKNPSLFSDFKDQHSYWENNCKAKPIVPKLKKDTTTLALQRRNKFPSPIPIAPIRRSEIKSLQRRDEFFSATSEGSTPIAIGPGFAFFIWEDMHFEKFGILIIQSFDVTDMDAWFSNMRKGFLALMDQGIKRLLLDLTGNAGGVLCLAYTLLGVLSPSPDYPFPATKYTYGTRTIPSKSLMRIAKCVDEIGIKGSAFKLQSFTNVSSRTDFPLEANWASEGETKPKIVNGIISGYTKFSPFLMDKCTLKQTPLLADIKPEFTTIVVISDGLCGSSCAVVVINLQQGRCPSIVLCDREESRRPNMYSFAGGQVLNFNNIKDIAKRSSCFDMLPNVSERLQMTMTYRAIFNMEDKRNPLEYYILPAHWETGYLQNYSEHFSSRWDGFFAKGLEIQADLANFTYDSSDSGNIIAYTT